MSEPTITITLEHAEAALECIDRDIDNSYSNGGLCCLFGLLYAGFMFGLGMGW